MRRAHQSTWCLSVCLSAASVMYSHCSALCWMPAQATRRHLLCPHGVPLMPQAQRGPSELLFPHSLLLAELSPPRPGRELHPSDPQDKTRGSPSAGTVRLFLICPPIDPIGCPSTCAHCPHSTHSPPSRPGPPQ